jgi:hypothetical protein
VKQRNESMSIADRVAGLVLAAALVIALYAIAVVGPNTALLAASVAASEHPRQTQSTTDVVPQSHANYFSSPVMAPDAGNAQPTATF